MPPDPRRSYSRLILLGFGSSEDLGIWSGSAHLKRSAVKSLVDAHVYRVEGSGGGQAFDVDALRADNEGSGWNDPMATRRGSRPSPSSFGV